MSFTPNVTMNIHAGWHRIGADCKAAIISCMPSVKIPGGRRGIGEVLNIEYLIGGKAVASKLVLTKVFVKQAQCGVPVRASVDVNRPWEGHDFHIVVPGAALRVGTCISKNCAQAIVEVVGADDEMFAAVERVDVQRLVDFIREHDGVEVVAVCSDVIIVQSRVFDTKTNESYWEQTKVPTTKKAVREFLGY